MIWMEQSRFYSGHKPAEIEEIITLSNSYG